MADSFYYAFENGGMSISEKRGILSLIPKKDRQKISQKIGDQSLIEQQLQNLKAVSLTLGKNVTYDY